MGYCMDQMDSHFRIPADQVDAALEAIKEIPGKEYAWVISDQYKCARTLREAFDAWRWESTPNGVGDYDEISFVGEKLGDDFVLFEAIAPYVDAGSFIEMHGEDGAIWRWVFDGKTCEEIYPTVSWD